MISRLRLDVYPYVRDAPGPVHRKVAQYHFLIRLDNPVD
jgi:hypothetical protein